MSAEIENNKEEETKEARRPLYVRALEQWQVGIKILELIICVVCVSLLYEPASLTELGKNRLHHVGIFYTTFTGYIVIILVLLVGRLLKDTLANKTSVLFSVVGAGLFLLSGVLMVADRAYLTKNYIFSPHMYLMEMFTACCAFAFVNTVIFGVDAFLTFKRREDF